MCAICTGRKYSTVGCHTFRSKTCSLIWNDVRAQVAVADLVHARLHDVREVELEVVVAQEVPPVLGRALGDLLEPGVGDPVERRPALKSVSWRSSSMTATLGCLGWYPPGRPG